MASVYNERKIGFEIKKTANLFKKKFGEIVKETSGKSDFSEQYCWILGYLYRRKDTVICQKDLEKAFYAKRATMSKLLTKLESEGYIERREVQGDKRLNQIALTEKGLLEQENIQNNIDCFDRKITSILSENERKILFEILDRIDNALEK